MGSARLKYTGWGEEIRSRHRDPATTSMRTSFQELTALLVGTGNLHSRMAAAFRVGSFTKPRKKTSEKEVIFLGWG